MVAPRICTCSRKKGVSSVLSVMRQRWPPPNIMPIVSWPIMAVEQGLFVRRVREVAQDGEDDGEGGEPLLAVDHVLGPAAPWAG